MTTTALESWAYWLTVAAIVLPLLGGVAAFGALATSSRASSQREAALTKYQADANAAIDAATARAAQLEPRKIAGAQRDVLWNALQNATAKGPVEMNVVHGDGEAMTLGFQIEVMFSDTGWEVADSRLVPIDAVGITLRAPTPEPAHAAIIRAAFGAANVAATAVVDPAVPAGRVRILVGTKPK